MTGLESVLDLPFAKAIAWFRARVPGFDALLPELEQHAERRAFTVAGAAQLALVTQVWQAIDRALEQGTTLADFKADVGDALAAAWGGASGSRLETIFRTHVQTAYCAGRYKQLTDPAVLSTRPYWYYDALADGRTSSLCRSLAGTVLSASDPFWATHNPPLHHRCRSAIRALKPSEAQARGISNSAPEVQPAKGFGKAPGADDWQPEASDYPADLWAIWGDKQLAT